MLQVNTVQFTIWNAITFGLTIMRRANSIHISVHQYIHQTGCMNVSIFIYLKGFFLKQFTTSNNEQNKQKNWNTLYIMIFYKTRKDTCLEKKIAIRVCTFIFISPFLWIFSLVFGEESQWYSFKKKLLINSYKKINCTCHHNADVNCVVQIRTVSKRVWAARNLTKEKVGY